MAFTTALNVCTRLSLSLLSVIALIMIACLVVSLSLYKLRTAFDLIVEQHLPIIIVAYELVQRNETIMIYIHNLAVSNTKGQQQILYYRTHDQFAHTSELVARLKNFAALQSFLPLTPIAEAHAYLSATFEKLNTAVEQHIQQHQHEAVLLKEHVHVHKRRRTSPQTSLSQEKNISATAYTQIPIPVTALNTIFSLALDVLVTQVMTMTYKRHDIEEEGFVDPVNSAVILQDLQPARNGLMMTFDSLSGQNHESLLALFSGKSQVSRNIDSLLLLYSQRSRRFIEALNALILYSNTVITIYTKNIINIIQLEKIFLFSHLISSLMITILLIKYLFRRIIQRLSHLCQAVEVAATGKEVQIDSHGEDEIANIARAVKGLIAARQQAEEVLRIAKEAADSANMAKTRLLASASHDLRQPLQALGLFVTALLEFHLTAETRLIAEKISLSVTTLRELLDAWLDISKLDTGVVVPDRTAISLATLIDRLVLEFKPVATAKHLRFLLGSCRGYVVSDPVLLDRMLRNLLANAIRHTISGGVLIGCRHRGRQIRVEIWDSGPGISVEQQKDIFREFHRVHHSSENAGVGLGLAIVDRTARLLGHRIFVESRLGRGSMFAVEVEAAETPENALVINPTPAVSSASSQRQDSSESSILSGRAIVVIDDDPLIRHGLQILLKSWGCTVIVADSGDSAVVELSRCEVVPEAIIADYWLSNGETGNKAIATLREAVDRPLPALLMITEITEALPALALEGLAQQHGLPVLRKPVTAEQLFSFLETAFLPPQKRIS